MSPLRRLFVIAFWLALALAYTAAILPGKEAPSLGWTDKVDHMTAFFTITFLGRAAYPQLGVLTLLALMTAFGGFIEVSQAVPFIHRDAEWNDWFADIAATCLGLIVAQPFAVLAQRRRGRRAAQRPPSALQQRRSRNCQPSRRAT